MIVKNSKRTFNLHFFCVRLRSRWHEKVYGYSSARTPTGTEKQPTHRPRVISELTSVPGTARI